MPGRHRGARLPVRGPQSRPPTPGGQGDTSRWMRHGGRGRVAPHWLRDAAPLHWARCPGQYAVGPPGGKGPGDVLLLCYLGGWAITLATGVNLNLETNPKELGSETS